MHCKLPECQCTYVVKMKGRMSVHIYFPCPLDKDKMATVILLRGSTQVYLYKQGRTQPGNMQRQIPNAILHPWTPQEGASQTKLNIRIPS